MASEFAGMSRMGPATFPWCQKVGGPTALPPERSEPTAEVSQDRIVGYDSNRVIDHTTKDKIGNLSHEGADAADRLYQGDCVRQSRRANRVSRVPESGWPFRSQR